MEKKKRSLHILIGFVLFVIAITYISYSIYVWKLPRVVLGFTETGSFTRLYEMWGTLELTTKYPGYDAVSEFFLAKEDLPEWNEEFGYEGDEIWINIKSIRGAQFAGVIHDIDYREDGAYVLVKYTLDSIENKSEIQSGEDVTAYYSSVTEVYDCIVPSSAIFTEGDETYIYTVHESSGILGREFIASKVRVYIKDEWNARTAVSHATSSIDDPIITNTDSNITMGTRVRFYP